MITPKISAALTLAALLSLALPSGAQAATEAEAPAEAALTLADQELFDAGSPARWLLPPGWTHAAAGNGYGLSITGAEAGLKSTIRPGGVFGDVVVEGQFTFTGPDGTAQLFVRDSAVGAYAAQLDAAGAVTLEKRGPGGVVLSSWRAQAEPQAVTGSARTLQLSALGGALRVTVDGIDVLTASDADPLPPGANQIAAVFATPAGTLAFDNYSVWVPSDVTPAEPVQPAMARRAARAVRNVAPPGNDDFGNRNTAAGGRYLHMANNAGATNEASEPIPALAADTANTVWYEFSPPASRDYLITSFGSSFNTVLAVYTSPPGPTLGSLTQVGFSDDVPGSLQAQLTLALDTTKTYYIQLGGRQGSGHFEFRIMDPADVAVPSTPAISTSAAGAPSTPVAHQGSTNDLTPVLAWAPRPSITPYAYLAEVSTASTFPSVLSSGVIQDPTRFWEVGPALNVPGPSTGEKYYWRVAALNFLGQTSTFSPPYSFTLDTQPPAPPALISPVVNSISATLRPTFTWQPVADATGYHIIIATNFSATTPASPDNDVDVATPTFTPANLPQGEYWFAVTSRDAAGNWSNSSEKRHFFVNISKTPVNGTNIITQAATNTADVVLTWTQIPGATYHLEVATDSSFAVVDTYGPLTTASYTVTGRPPGTYFWRVSVNGLAMPMSLARNFTVTPPLPQAPVIQTTGALAGALADKAITNNETPSFDWTVPANWVTPPAGSFLSRYELQLASDQAFSQIVDTVHVNYTGMPTLESSGQWPSPLAPGTYYWRVRAVTNLEVKGAFSPVYSFTLDTQPLAAPVITFPVVTPPSYKAVTGQRPAIKWQPVQGAVRYQVVIATNFSGTTRVVDTFVNGTSFTPPSDLALGTHWLFVESQDAAGNVRAITGGNGGAFNVHLGQTPIDGKIFVAKAPANSMDVAFTWESTQGATTYRLEVAVDGDTSFTGDVRSFEVAGNTKTVSIPVTHLSSPCYWRVYKTGTTPPSGYYASFVVLGAPPAGPSITAGGLVQDDVITTQTPVVFAWTLTSNPADFAVYSYQLQLATDSKFSQLLMTNLPSPSNATSYGLPAPLPPGTYYWRVRSIYVPSGIISPYSNTYRFTVVEPSATMPVLTKPLANTTLSTARPTFQWKPVPLSKGYRVRITTNPSGNNPVSTDVELTKTTFTPTTNLPQGEYSFGVESKDAQGDWSGFAEQRVFVVNYGLIPVNQAALVAKAPAFTTNVVLKWSKLKAPNPANTFRVQVDNNSDFSSPSSTSPVLPASASTYTFTNQPPGLYYWRVLVTGHPTAPTSQAYRYTVTPPLPVAPVIENPIPVLTNDSTPRFDWKVPANWTTPPPGGSLSYQLQIATDKKFTQLVAGTPVQSVVTDYDWPTDLTPGVTYYWRVRAVTNLNVPGAFSKVSSFTLDTTAPTQPTQKAPADAAVSTSSRPAFSWTAGANGAVLYRLEVYDDPTFVALPVYTANTPKLAHTPTQSLPQGVYYWKVHGLDKAGNGGDVTVPSRAITIDCRTAPAEGDIIEAPTTAGVPVNFKWVAPTGAPAGTTYIIEIDSDLDGTSDTTLPPVTALTTTSAALPPGYYQYRLIASNSVGTTEWRAFIIVPQ